MKIAIILVVFWAASFSNGLAQETLRPPSGETAKDGAWLENISDLKDSMNAILVENESLLAENGLLRKKILELQNRLAAVESQKKELTKEPLRLEALLRTKTESLVLLEKNFKAASDDLAQAKTENASLKQDIDARKKKQEALIKEAQDLKDQISKLKDQLQTQKKAKSTASKDLESRKANLDRSWTDVQRKKGRAAQDLLQAEAAAAGPNEKVASLSGEQKKLEDQLAKANKDLKVITGDKQKLQEENTRLQEQEKKKIDQLNKELENLKARNKELEQAFAQTKKDVEQKKAARSAKMTDQGDLQDKLTALSKERDSLKEQIATLTDSVVSLNREKTMMESLLEAQAKASRMKARSSAKRLKTSDLELLGYQYAASGQYEKAIEQYQLALQLNPKRKDIYYNLGFIYSKLEKYDEAINYFTRVLEIDPKDKETHYNLSKIYKTLAKPELSQQHYARYLELKGK